MDIRVTSHDTILDACREDPSICLTCIADDSIAETEQVTMLWQASAIGDKFLAQSLIDCGSDVNFFRASDRVSCLYIAAQNGHRDLCELLLSCGANINVRKNTMATPLFIATQRNHVDVVSLLLDHQADTELENDQRCTPFVLACNMGHTAIAQRLMRAGCDVFHRGTGLSAMMWCKSERRLETLEELRRFLLEQYLLPRTATAVFRELFASWKSFARGKMIERKEREDRERALIAEKERARRQLLEGGPLPEWQELSTVAFDNRLHCPSISLGSGPRSVFFDARERALAVIPSPLRRARLEPQSSVEEDSVAIAANQFFTSLKTPTLCITREQTSTRCHQKRSDAYELIGKSKEILSCNDSRVFHELHETLRTQQFR